MAIVEPDEEISPLLEAEAWRDIVQSENWRYFKELLYNHKLHLESQVLIAVGNRKFDEASDYNSRLSECGKILQLVDGRLAELRKGKE